MNKSGFNNYHKIAAHYQKRMCRKFGICDIRGHILKSIYLMSCLRPSDFPNNFQACNQKFLRAGVVSWD